MHYLDPQDRLHGASVTETPTYPRVHVLLSVTGIFFWKSLGAALGATTGQAKAPTWCVR
jgi:hypothetical protein